MIHTEVMIIECDLLKNNLEFDFENRRGQVPEIFHKESLKVL